MIFVNFKTYKEGSGENAAALVDILSEVSIQTSLKIIPVVQAIDLQLIIAETNLEVWVQHVDPVDFGPNTGWILPARISKIGAKGVFLNHSEHKFEDLSQLGKTIEISKKNGLSTCVFGSTLEELEKILRFSPSFAAYEPPEFIGSTTTSVAQAQPKIISQASEISKSYHIPLIVGAGIHSQKDVRKSLELGAIGVAVATDIVCAKDPKKELLDLTEGFK